MKGFIVIDGQVTKVLENIVEIDKVKGTITFELGNSKLQNVKFDMLEVVVDTDQSVLKVGDTIPENFVDKSQSIMADPQNVIIDALGQELTSIKMELMILKGGTST